MKILKVVGGSFIVGSFVWLSLSKPSVGEPGGVGPLIACLFLAVGVPVVFGILSINKAAEMDRQAEVAGQAWAIPYVLRDVQNEWNE